MLYASNKQTNLRLLYASRDYYNKSIRNYHPKVGELIDIWKFQPLYGKIDTNFNVAYPSEAYLGIIKGTDRLAINFVSDAFGAMRDYLAKGEAFGNIKRDDLFFYPFNVVKGWESVNDMYNAHISEFYSVLYEKFLIRPENNGSITSFDSFLTAFNLFLDIHVPTRPLTKSGFILKHDCPYSISGLTIEIDSKDYSDDSRKVKDYYDQKNFYAMYLKLAANFGFYVDKNCPWRLVANLTSPAWQKNPYLVEIMGKYFSNGYSLDKVFDTYYYKTYRIDVEILKTYVVQFYNSYVSQKPRLFKPRMCNTETIVDHTTRRPVTLSEVSLQYDSAFWLKMYLSIRLKEMQIKISNSQLENIHSQISHDYHSRGYDAALDSLNAHVVNYLKIDMDKVINSKTSLQEGQSVVKSSVAVPVVGGGTPMSTATSTY